MGQLKLIWNWRLNEWACLHVIQLSNPSARASCTQTASHGRTGSVVPSLCRGYCLGEPWLAQVQTTLIIVSNNFRLWRTEFPWTVEQSHPHCPLGRVTITSHPQILLVGTGQGNGLEHTVGQSRRPLEIPSYLNYYSVSLGQLQDRGEFYCEGLQSPSANDFSSILARHQPSLHQLHNPAVLKKKGTFITLNTTC